MSAEWRLMFTRAARREWEDLDLVTRNRVDMNLIWLRNNVTIIPHKAPQSPFYKTYKVRVGEFRILYQLYHSEGIIKIYSIGRRDKVYK